MSAIPLLNELLSDIRTIGSIGSKTLIIIPFYAEYNILEKHLNHLAKQTMHDFDVILVPEPTSDEHRLVEIVRRVGCPFGVIIAKRKFNSGGTGGFFTGQKYALAHGYKYMILADADCYPVDKELVENLIKNGEHGFVSPKGITTNNDQLLDSVPARPAASPGHYSLFSREFIRRIGLYYAPLFYGTDDVEYNIRIQKINAKPFTVENYCESTLFGHGTLDRKFVKYWLYLLNELVIYTDAIGFLKLSAKFILSLACVLLFFPEESKKVFQIMLGQALAFSYGKPAYDALAKPNILRILKSDEVPGIANYLQIDNTERLPSWLGKSLGELFALFRKDVLVSDNVFGFRAILNAAAARKLAYKIDDERVLLAAGNKNILIHLGKLFLFVFLSPLLLMIFLVVFVPIKIVKYPKTMGYGLD
ncbi:hypothetical protein COT30_03460 [Candidatus Micrarchaeota archaeon CG08_land_8_20_14_0_20_49_17]|nr:MAG: hypothetical protein AUJ13_04255 [Candidatus Micrarchaeota archaeon CG1_02_49_24]PIU09633.1 MAG: hypothetical protein COT30_03460 [Candidatus Micrarchaeota archaeon CG08_land_8_20_14_0_20_49_17]PIZ94880.1 MAG: hypothetical protein COX84_04840 [Candidatus Micrarchaeota archaeon CG_4_10_14_0_2_um_filter_49_7]HII54152.1 glycosyltransferase family 2 protein [Candidatus Micrarchaeota archaeon]